MLSDETASGKYPIESINVMKNVIDYTQKHTHEPIMTSFTREVSPSRQQAISMTIIALAKETEAVAIVAETKSGATALQIASHRPTVPIIAVTSNLRINQQLTIVYGTKSYIRPDDKLQATKLTNWLHKNRVLGKGDTVVTASGQYPGVVGTTDTIKVRVL
jgi:pyruvate kinase